MQEVLQSQIGWETAVVALLLLERDALDFLSTKLQLFVFCFRRVTREACSSCRKFALLVRNCALPGCQWKTLPRTESLFDFGLVLNISMDAAMRLTVDCDVLGTVIVQICREANVCRSQIFACQQ